MARNAWDQVRFGAFVRRYRMAERLTIAEVQTRAAPFIKHSSNITNLEHGDVARPNVETIYGLSIGLDVQMSYLLEKMGYGDDATRVKNFTMPERLVLRDALAGYLARHDCPEYAELLEEFQEPNRSMALHFVRELNAELRDEEFAALQQSLALQEQRMAEVTAELEAAMDVVHELTRERDELRSAAEETTRED